MRCPDCGSEVRPSKKHPGCYLCDACKKRYTSSSVIDDRAEEYGVSDGGRYGKPKPTRNTDSSKKRIQKKKKHGAAIWVLTALVVIAGVFVGVKLLTDKGNKKTSSGSKTNSASTVKESDNKTGTKKDGVYGPGDTAEFNGVKIQLAGYEESEGNEWAVPEEGNTFLLINMEITNLSDDELPISSMTSFESYSGDTKLDYSSGAFTALSTDPEKQQLDGNLSAGEKLNGYLCLEAPSNWTSLEMRYTDSVWENGNIKFVITK